MKKFCDFFFHFENCSDRRVYRKLFFSFPKYLYVFISCYYLQKLIRQSTFCYYIYLSLNYFWGDCNSLKEGVSLFYELITIEFYATVNSVSERGALISIVERFNGFFDNIISFQNLNKKYYVFKQHSNRPTPR